jgi:hypothetical protein
MAWDEDIFGPQKGKAPQSATAWDEDIFGPKPSIGVEGATPSKMLPPSKAPPRDGNMLTNFAQGLNRGVLATAGIPVDSVLNVVDLLKAGYGAAKGALGGTDLPQLTNREQIPGSSDWLLSKARDVSPMIADPADPGGIPASMGMGVGGTLPFTGGSNILRQLAMGAASGVGGQVGANMGGPESAILGGMLPSLGGQLGSMALRRSVRGKSGADMAQNQFDLKAAGVTTPTVGMTSQNPTIQAIENLLAKMPISGPVIRENALNVQSQLQNKANQTRDSLSSRYNPYEAGKAIDSGVTAFNAAKSADASNLYNNINIPWIKQFQTPETLSRVTDMTRPIVGAPAISQGLLGKDSGLPARVKSTFNADEAGTTGIPYEAIKQSRSLIGEMIPQQIWDKAPGVQQTRSIYGALSSDLKDAANASGQLPQFNRANDFYRGLTGRMDQLTPFADKMNPEASYRALKSAANNGGSSAVTLVRSLPSEQRRIVSATFIDELGKSNPGQQNAEGNRFSSETFLTNWNKLDDKSKSTLFSPQVGGPQIRDNLDKIANAASLLRDQGKILANPSGTGPALINASALATSAGAVGAAFLGNTWALAPVALGAGALQGGAKALTNPKFSAWLARSTEITPQQQAQHLSRLGVIIQQTKDTETRQQMADYYRALTGQ